MKKFKLTMLFMVVSSFVLTACSDVNTKANAINEVSANKTQQVIKVAHTNYYYPYDYVDENGNSDGYEVAVVKELAKLLPEYSFEFYPTSDDDLLLGVQSGKYDLGTKGIWKTSAREKKYLFTQNPIGASQIGMVVRSTDKDKYQSLELFAQNKGRLIPIAPQDARYMIIDAYNKAHSNEQIELKASENFVITDAYTYLLENRYDGFLEPKLSFEANVNKENAVYSRFKDSLSYVDYKAIATYPLFNKNHSELVAKFDEALKILHDNGTLQKLELEYLGYEILSTID